MTLLNIHWRYYHLINCMIPSPHCLLTKAGVSTLDIRTRLRITEAELAIVQREVSDLIAERNSHETSARQYEESWKFAVQECGRYVLRGEREGEREKEEREREWGRY